MCVKSGDIYWHRELPPADAEPMGECVIEATSGRVPGTLAHRDELWHECYRDLMIKAGTRITQEVNRVGGNCAHVLNESVDSEHDVGKRPSMVAWQLRLHDLPPVARAAGRLESAFGSLRRTVGCQIDQLGLELIASYWVGVLPRGSAVVLGHYERAQSAIPPYSLNAFLGTPPEGATQPPDSRVCR
jgi:hypothetical protein